MRGFRSAVGVGVSVAVFVTAGVAVAVTSGKVFYEAGKRAKPPYVFVVVSHGKVTKVRWAIHEPCNPAPNYFGKFNYGVTQLDAPIKNGHFSKTVQYDWGGGAAGPNTTITKIKGTISGKHATVKLNEEDDITSWGVCTGSHKFKATKTSRFH